MSVPTRCHGHEGHDLVLIVGPQKEQIRVHRAVIALCCPDLLKEATFPFSGEAHLPKDDPDTILELLELVCPSSDEKPRMDAASQARLAKAASKFGCVGRVCDKFYSIFLSIFFNTQALGLHTTCTEVEDLWNLSTSAYWLRSGRWFEKFTSLLVVGEDRSFLSMVRAAGDKEFAYSLSLALEETKRARLFRPRSSSFSFGGLCLKCFHAAKESFARIPDCDMCAFLETAWGPNERSSRASESSVAQVITQNLAAASSAFQQSPEEPEPSAPIASQTERPAETVFLLEPEGLRAEQPQNHLLSEEVALQGEHFLERSPDGKGSMIRSWTSQHISLQYANPSWSAEELRLAYYDRRRIQTTSKGAAPAPKPPPALPRAWGPSSRFPITSKMAAPAHKSSPAPDEAWGYSSSFPLAWDDNAPARRSPSTRDRSASPSIHPPKTSLASRMSRPSAPSNGSVAKPLQPQGDVYVPSFSREREERMFNLSDPVSLERCTERRRGRGRGRRGGRQ